MPELAPDSNLDATVRGIIEGAGYVLKNPPQIDGAKLSVWAIGTDEVLVAGMVASATAYEGPIRSLGNGITQVRTLITDSLGDSVHVKIIPFVLIDGRIANKDELSNAFDIGIFDDTNTLREWFSQNLNKPLAPEDKEDFDAYGDYIDTVANYFNTK